MKQITLFTYSVDFALSNKYLDVIIQCLESIILNDDKVEVLFCKVQKYRIKPQLCH